jgi:glycolate oxidase FAD binding subunit
MDANLEILADRIRHAAATRSPIRCRGGGTKDFYGQSLNGEILDTRGYRGIVHYDPTELVLTARCGTPLAEIDAALAAQGQMLAFEPPHFGAGATLGGCVAAGLSGPRRQTVGAVRDFVLGASVMNHHGDVLSFGGQVMKNVAGYDISRLLVGSLGTLGLIVDVSLKVLPRPTSERTLSLSLDQTTAFEKLNEWVKLSAPISASAWHDDTLTLRLSGTNASIDVATSCITKEFSVNRLDRNQAEIFWAGVREHTHPFFSGNTPLWRLSVPPTAPPLTWDLPCLIEWAGALRWLRGDIDASAIRSEVERLGGHVTRFRGAAAGSVFHPLPATLHKIHRALKFELDPLNLFSPGRLYDDI